MLLFSNACRLVCVGIFCLGFTIAQAQSGPDRQPERVAGAAEADIRLARSPDALTLSAQLHLRLPSGVEDALQKAVPIYFVVQADVLRERWYWSDQRISRRARTHRLAYQPLTRQWRLSTAMGSGPGATLDYALHQNHASLESALAAMSRLAAWPVAEAAQLPADGTLWVDFRFWLDPALLPRPFQLGLSAQADWGLDIRRRLPVPVESTTQPASVSPPDAEPPSQSDGGSAGRTP